MGGMDNTTSATAKTPGYNRRLVIFFTHGRNGRKMAWYWSAYQMRAFRVPLADAEMWKATEQADFIPCHPMRPCTCATPHQAD